jgi:hypothetical protein
VDRSTANKSAHTVGTALKNLADISSSARCPGHSIVEIGQSCVSFMRYDLGFIDLEQKTLRPTDNPFGSGL